MLTPCATPSCPMVPPRGRPQLVLHLHRLDDQQLLAGRDRVAGVRPRATTTFPGMSARTSWGPPAAASGRDRVARSRRAARRSDSTSTSNLNPSTSTSRRIAPRPSRSRRLEDDRDAAGAVHEDVASAAPVVEQDVRRLAVHDQMSLRKDTDPGVGLVAQAAGRREPGADAVRRLGRRHRRPSVDPPLPPFGPPAAVAGRRAGIGRSAPAVPPLLPRDIGVAAVAAVAVVERAEARGDQRQAHRVASRGLAVPVARRPSPSTGRRAGTSRSAPRTGETGAWSGSRRSRSRRARGAGCRSPHRGRGRGP